MGSENKLQRQKKDPLKLGKKEDRENSPGERRGGKAQRSGGREEGMEGDRLEGRERKRATKREPDPLS